MSTATRSYRSIYNLWAKCDKTKTKTACLFDNIFRRFFAIIFRNLSETLAESDSNEKDQIQKYISQIRLLEIDSVVMYRLAMKYVHSENHLEHCPDYQKVYDHIA